MLKAILIGPSFPPERLETLTLISTDPPEASDASNSTFVSFGTSETNYML